jgi:hypothetical protein
MREQLWEPLETCLLIRDLQIDTQFIYSNRDVKIATALFYVVNYYIGFMPKVAVVRDSHKLFLSLTGEFE